MELFTAQSIIRNARLAPATGEPIWARIHAFQSDLSEAWHEHDGELATGFFRTEERECDFTSHNGPETTYYDHPVLMGVKIEGEGAPRYLSAEDFGAQADTASLEADLDFLITEAQEAAE